MTRGAHQITVGSQSLEFLVKRSDRKTLAISVLPDSSIEVRAPMASTDAAVVERVKKRSRWIMNQQRFFSQFLPSTPSRRFIAGETHLYLGRRYKLKINASKLDSVKLTNGNFSILSSEPQNAAHTAKLIENWKALKAKSKFAERLSHCRSLFENADDVTPRKVSIRPLKARWGSMTSKQHLVLNLRLIDAPAACIDYVITHELCHMIHPDHSRSFYDLLSVTMPEWKKRKLMLETTLA